MEKVRKTGTIILHTGLVIFTAFLWYHMHIHMLGEIPYEMHIDEFGIGYDAWSLLHYGVDKWLMRFPVYPNNYGGGSSMMYVLLCMVSVKIFGGTSTFALRFPAAFMSIVSMICTFLITRKLEKKWLPYGAVIMFNILPYYTMQSRVALDCNMMMCGMLMVMYFCYRAVEKDSLMSWVAAGIAAGVSLYTYSLAWVVVPVVLVICILYTIRLKILTVKKTFAMGIPCGILAFPLILCVIVNKFGLDTIQLGLITIPKLLIYRSGELALSNIAESAKCFYKTIFYGDGMAVNAVYGYFTMYTVSVPLVILGGIISMVRMVKAFMKGEKDVLVIVNAVFIAEFILGVFIGSNDGLIGNAGINVNRLNGIYGALLIYLMVGILYICRCFAWLVQQTGIKYIKVLNIVPVVMIIILYGKQYEAWDNYYFTAKIPAQYGFAAPLDEVVEYFGEDLFTKSVHMDINYAQFLLATHLSPYEFDAPSLDRDYTSLAAWNNVTFDVYGEYGVVEEDSIYVIYKEHTEFVDYFLQFGMNMVEFERYVCFYN